MIIHAFRAMLESLLSIDYGGSLGTIDIAHKAVHDGEAYSVHHRANVAASEYVRLAISAPALDDARLHMKFHVSASESAVLRVVEDVNITGGDSLEICNRNRNSSNASGVPSGSIKAGDSSGTALTWTNGTSPKDIDGEFIHSGKHTGGASNGFTMEWHLKANTTTIIDVASEAANNDISVKAFWYETP